MLDWYLRPPRPGQLEGFLFLQGHEQGLVVSRLVVVVDLTRLFEDWNILPLIFKNLYLFLHLFEDWANAGVIKTQS
jgi:hypothetical protein